MASYDIWDRPGEKLYETGVDRGMVYPKGEEPASWNGLVSVSHAPTGGSATPYFIDGINHVNEVLGEQFSGTIQAFTYPDVFSKCDGTYYEDAGVYYEQQSRLEFDLSYRTSVGNDLQATDYGYKIHLIYNALAAPTTRDYGSLGDSIDPTTFSWAIVTTPIRIPPKLPTSKLTIDSTKCDPDQLQSLEDILYGEGGTPPRMPSMSEVITLFNDWDPLELLWNSTTGLSPIKYQGIPDLNGSPVEGLYLIPSESRLIPLEGQDGFYILT